MSGGFPPHELAYVLDQSRAALFLSSAEMRGKAEAVMSEDLEARPTRIDVLECGADAGKLGAPLELVDVPGGGKDRGGLMLYTSGTTSKPVRITTSEHA